MEAIFKIKPAEFDEIIRQIKNYFLRENTDSLEITISLKDLGSNAAYLEKFQRSIAEADADTNCITFSPEEFKSFVQTRIAQ